MKYISKKEIIVLSIILVIAAAAWLSYTLIKDASVPDKVADCDALSPAEARAGCSGFEAELDKTICFSDKQRISYGKYGFRKKLVVKEPTVVTQYVWENTDQKHMYYGIYRDELLTKAVVEIDQGYNLKAGWAFEEGAELEEYPEYQKMIVQPLAAGTYYIGVYTSKANENFDFLYRSQYSVKKEAYSLQENKAQHFFICEKEQATFFRINGEAQQEIEIIISSLKGDLQLCDENKDVIQTLEQKGKGKINGYRGIAYRVKLPKEGTCYIKSVEELDTAPATQVLPEAYIIYRSI